jgi:hypothetical protein
VQVAQACVLRPESGKLVEVYSDPATGARCYRALVEAAMG